MRPWLEAVADVMRARPQVGFVAIGQPFHKPLEREFGAERVTGVPFTQLESYPAAMTLMDIALAPAGKGNFFRGKSDLRFLEAGALGIATVGDPDVYPSIEHGVTGFHAADAAAAREHLLALVDDADLRGRVGDAARAYVERERSMTVMAPAVGERAARGRRPGPAPCRIGLGGGAGCPFPSAPSRSCTPSTRRT